MKMIISCWKGHYYRVYQRRELLERTYRWVQEWDEENLRGRDLVQRSWWGRINFLWMIFEPAL